MAKIATFCNNGQVEALLTKGGSLARSIIGTKLAEPASQINLQTAHASIFGSKLDAAALQARLRRKRSASYIESMAQLDAGTHLHGARAEQATQNLLAAIRQELPDVSIDALPLGIIAKCHLGQPYEVHTLTCAGSIVQHFKTGQALPQAMERARSLAQHAEYAFIEVYTSRLVTVSHSGHTESARVPWRPVGLSQAGIAACSARCR